MCVCVCLKFFLFVLTVHVCIERWQSLLLCVQACFGFVIVCHSVCVTMTEQCRQTGLVTLTQVTETVRARICVHACSAF